jgi:hypothetical protein
VAAAIEREMCRTGKSFGRVLNDALRAAFARRKRAAQPTPFVVEARALGLVPGLDYAKVSELSEVAERRANQ